jgi:hypothetical protein
LPKKRQHRTMLRSRSKENQTWPDQDRLSGSAVQIRDVTTTLSLLLLNTIPHSWTGLSSLPMGQSLRQVNWAPLLAQVLKARALDRRLRCIVRFQIDVQMLIPNAHSTCSVCS